MKRPAGTVMFTIFILSFFGCVREPQLPNSRGDVPDEPREIFVLSYAETISVIHPDKVALRCPEDECIFNDLVKTGFAPNHLEFLHGSLFCINSLGNTLTVYSEDTLQEADEVHLGRNTNPWQLIVDGAGEYGYIPCYVAGTILKLDLSSLSGSPIIAASDLLLPEGGVICADSSGTELLFVAQCNNDAITVGPGAVQVLNTVTSAVINVDVEPDGFDPEKDSGSNPQAILAFQDQGEVHVVCTGNYDQDDGEVVVIDTDTLEVTRRIAVGGSPNAFPAAIDKQRQRVFLVSYGCGITVYNYLTGDVERGTDNPVLPEGAAEAPFFSGVIYDPETDFLFISDYSNDSVRVLDAADPDFRTVTTLHASDGPGYLLLTEE